MHLDVKTSGPDKQLGTRHWWGRLAGRLVLTPRWATSGGKDGTCLSEAWTGTWAEDTWGKRQVWFRGVLGIFPSVGGWWGLRGR